MRDDQLSRLFGSLADASDPNPAFADDLFERLLVEASGARPQRRPWFILLAAALLVVALGAGAALGSGLLQLPWLVVTPSPTGTPQPSGTPAPSGEPSLPPATDDILPASSLARTLTSVELHLQPSFGSDLVATIPAGETVLIQVAEAFGPREVDGARWYPVAWSAGFDGWPESPLSSQGGWLPVTRDGAATVEAVSPSCPGGQTDVATMAGMLGWDRLFCFGESEIALDGSWVEGAGGITPLTIEPAWLNPFNGGAIAAGTGQLTFVLAPGAGVPADVEAGDRVRIIGHHDDPAARDCVIDLEGAQPAEPAQLYCRQVFVVTSVVRLGAQTNEPPAVGALAGTLVDGVRLRGEPGTGGEVLGTLPLGSSSYVVDGPRQADGYTWWLLAGLGIPWQSGCTTPTGTTPFECPVWYGWAAEASDTGDRWLGGVNQACPPGEGMLTPDYGRQPLEYLACFGGATRTYVGWLPEVPDDAGLGGACPEMPDDLLWVACDLGYTRLLVSSEEDFSGAGLSLAIDPASGIALEPMRGQWLAVTGRFDHPAAGCEELGPGWAPLLCRARFVVASIEPVNVAP